MPPTLTISTRPSKTRSGYTSRAVVSGGPVQYLIVRSPSTGDDAVDIRNDTTGGFRTRYYFPESNPTLGIDLAPFFIFGQSNQALAVGASPAAGLLAEDAATYELSYKYYSDVSYTADGQTFLIVNGWSWIGEDSTYGQNLARYTPALVASPFSVTALGKFLTKLERPKIFIVPDVGTFAPTLYLIATPEMVTLATPSAQYIRFFASGGGADAGQIFKPTAFNVWRMTLPTAVANAIGAGDEVSFVAQFAETSGGPYTAITETLTADVVERCGGQPVLWRNSKGGWDVWVFPGRAPEAMEARAMGRYSVQNQDLATATATARTYGTSADFTLSLRDVGLSLNEIEALREIAISPSVLAWRGGQWVQAIPQNVGATIDPFNPTHSISLELELPSIMPS